MLQEIKEIVLLRAGHLKTAVRFVSLLLFSVFWGSASQAIEWSKAAVEARIAHFPGCKLVIAEMVSSCQPRGVINISVDRDVEDASAIELTLTVLLAASPRDKSQEIESIETAARAMQAAFPEWSNGENWTKKSLLALRTAALKEPDLHVEKEWTTEFDNLHISVHQAGFVDVTSTSAEITVGKK